MELSLDMQLNLYRIVQEQLRNILKYAKADKISLHFFRENNSVVLKLADNGIGFNIENAKSGIGLGNMKRKAELFSGSFHINSSGGNGCTMTVNVPLSSKN